MWNRMKSWENGTFIFCGDIDVVSGRLRVPSIWKNPIAHFFKANLKLLKWGTLYPRKTGHTHFFYRQLNFPSEPGVANEILEKVA